jgi:hypothetical protein
MKSLSPILEDILDRAGDTASVMLELAGPPLNWTWNGTSPNNFRNQIEGVDQQVAVLADAETAVTTAAADWDASLGSLVDDGSLGLRLARVRFKDQPVKLALFDGIALASDGRESRYQFALDFEAAWKRAEPAWVFKDGVTLASYTARREAIRGKETAYRDAVKNEQHERAYLHSLAAAVNDGSVDWYAVATATFPEATVAGQLVRTIPTTYNPDQPPSKLVFVEHLSPAPSEGRLKWRASRGEHFFILGKGPGAPEFELMLNGVTETEWLGQGLAPGLWEFKGYARNAHGNGPVSEVVSLTVAVAAAA